MKNTKKLAALLLAAIMVMALAACGNKSANEGSDSLYVGTAMQDEGTAEPAESAEPAVESSPVMAAVYDNFVNGERFGEIQEMYMGYAHFETALKGDFVDVVENDGLDAGCHESLGDVEADTVGCACDPGIFPFEGEWICCHRCCFI